MSNTSPQLISMNGVDIKVGQKVYLLRTPVSKEHIFLKGEVIAITPTRIHVSALDLTLYKVFKRKPNQLIVVQDGDM